MGDLSVGSGSGTTLNVTATTAPMGQAYGLTLGTTTLAGDVTFNVANNTNGAGNALGTLTLGPVSGAGFGITKAGAGRLTLAGANDYSGNTTISGGTLRLADGSTNNIASSPRIAIGNGATLDVSGLDSGTLTLGATAAQTLAGPASGAATISGSMIVSSGSTLTGGSGATLSITGSLTLSGGSLSSFAITPAGAGNAGSPLVSVAGTLTGPASGTHTLNFTGTAASGTYDLFSYAPSMLDAGQFALGTLPAGSFSFNLAVSGTELDLVVSNPAINAEWDVNAGGSFNQATNWFPQNVPSGAGVIATFGNGHSTSISGTPPSLTVSIDGADTVGGLAFTNTNGTGFILGNDSVSGHGLTINNSGLGATIADSATAEQQIDANLTLADNVTFNIAGGSSLLMTVGSIGETGSHSLTKIGAGTLTLDLPNSYSGGTIVTNGTLNITGTGTIGSGSLEVDGSAGNASIVDLQNSQTVTGLTGTVSGGSAAIDVAAGKTLTLNQASNQSFAGTLALVGGTPGAVFTKSGAGTETLTAAPQLGDHATINVSSGTLKVNAGTGTVSVGTGVTANLTGSSTLELAGPLSALGTATAGQRVDISNDSTAAAGVLVSGGNQQVGGIDGTGTVQVTPPASGTASLTADHITAGALVIGGSPTSSAIVSIAPSDTSGNPTATSGFALAGSLTAAGSMSGETGNASSLLAAGDASSDGAALLGASAAGGSSVGSGTTAVPEPSSIVLILLGSLACLLPVLRRRSSATKTSA